MCALVGEHGQSLAPQLGKVAPGGRRERAGGAGKARLGAWSAEGAPVEGPALWPLALELDDRVHALHAWCCTSYLGWREAGVRASLSSLLSAHAEGPRRRTTGREAGGVGAGRGVVGAAGTGVVGGDVGVVGVLGGDAGTFGAGTGVISATTAGVISGTALTGAACLAAQAGCPSVAGKAAVTREAIFAPTSPSEPQLDTPEDDPNDEAPGQTVRLACRCISVHHTHRHRHLSTPHERPPCEQRARHEVMHGQARLALRAWRC